MSTLTVEVKIDGKVHSRTTLERDGTARGFHIDWKAASGRARKFHTTLPGDVPDQLAAMALLARISQDLWNHTEGK